MALPIFAQAMMAIHALHGFYPVLPLFRRLGLRTELEISAERYALKALRGDFETVGSDPVTAPELAFEAARPSDG